MKIKTLFLLVLVAVLALFAIGSANAQSNWSIRQAGCGEMFLIGSSPDVVQVFIGGSDNTAFINQEYTGNYFASGVAIAVPYKPAYRVAVIDILTKQTLLYNGYYQCGLPPRGPLPAAKGQ